jgi:hypothetical protein
LPPAQATSTTEPFQASASASTHPWSSSQASISRFAITVLLGPSGTPSVPTCTARIDTM